MTGAHAAPRRALSFDRTEGTVVTIRLGTLGREPALVVIGVLGPLAAVLVSLAPGLSPGWQVGITTAVYAAAGVVTALIVASDKLAPALLGFGQALLNLALAAGAPLTDPQQTAIMTAVSLVIAAFVRTQVVAPLPPAPPPFTPAPIPVTVLPPPRSDNAPPSLDSRSDHPGSPYIPGQP